LACKDWKNLLQQLIDSKAKVDFNQGLDIRLMTKEKIEMLNQIKIKEIHFAWDKYSDKDIILPKLRLFAEHSKILKKFSGHNAIVYTLTNFDTTFEQDLERIYILRDLGYTPYVMIYNKKNASEKVRLLQRWCNNRIIFRTVPRFEEYDRKKG
jgi:hypothetical protein